MTDQQNNLEMLKDLLGTLSTEQQAWLGGYLTALNQSTTQFINIGNQIPTIPTLANTQQAANLTGPAAALAQKPQKTLGKIKVLYGTRTGNAKQIAETFAEQSVTFGIETELVSLADYNPKSLKKESHILVVVSTDGEGEPPVSAQEFYDYLHSSKVPKLENLEYSVLALGDSSYKYYCKTGKDIDLRLQEHGAKQISPRVDCDLNFEDPAQEWMNKLLEELKDKKNGHSVPGFQAQATNFGATPSLTVTKHSKKNPFKATITDKILLNGKSSSKETYHYEISLEDSGLAYKPGDALGVISKNPEFLADKIIETSGFDPNTKIKLGDNTKPLRDALIHNFEITTLNKLVLENYAKTSNNEKLLELINYDEKLDDYLYGRDVLDLIIDYPTKLSAEEFVGTLRKLQPRLYSIASSQTQNPDEVHITVATVKYDKNNRERLGACSTYLSDRLNEGDELQVYIDPNLSFKLPDNPETPIIMIGPGTGIAPFRSFLQERDEMEAEGKNWLFFGDRNFTTDFLYQTELQKYLKTKLLTKLDVAFSRDQSEKIYVQDKIKNNGKEFYNWIHEGAHIYLCGDKDHMARDVKNTIIEILKSEGNMDDKKASAFLKDLQKSGRFQEDVY